MDINQAATIRSIAFGTAKVFLKENGIQSEYVHPGIFLVNRTSAMRSKFANEFSFEEDVYKWILMLINEQLETEPGFKENSVRLYYAGKDDENLWLGIIGKGMN